MKHETLNSIVGFAGLGLAAITAWHQFGPNRDSLGLFNEGRVEVGRKIEIVPSSTFNHATGELQPVIGPVTWKVRAHNIHDRPVSLVSFEVFLLTESDHRSFYSNMRPRFSSYDPARPDQLLPENIPPNESRAYLVSLYVPFVADEDTEKPCEGQFNELMTIERCFLRKNRDLFGNRVEVMEHGEEQFSARWLDGFSGPRFVVVIETADGSEFSTLLSFRPV